MPIFFIKSGVEAKNSHLYLFTLLAFIILFLNIKTAHAQSYCYKDGSMQSSGWKMSPPGNSFTNGQVIGSTTAAVTYKMPTPQTRPLIMAGSPNVSDNIYNAIPMEKTPGVGVRVQWAGYSATAGINVTKQVPYGTILTRRYWQEIFKASYSSSFSIVFFYNYEIVVIDKEKYKGGKLIITDTTQSIASTSTERAGDIPQLCVQGFINLLTAVSSELNVPELPEPAKPTCASAQIGFTAKMSPINASQLAAFGSNREQGIPGELKFRLIGNNCAKGTVIKAYFTDARVTSAENNYLYSTNETVGVRLYYNEDQDPIKMGPAPVGSSLPLRSPILEGPAMSDNSSLYIPITAQYVRLPYVGANGVKAGGMQAAAIVTFLYD